MTVSGLLSTPVKGLRIMPRTEVRLERDGARDDRRFYVVDERNRMLNGKQLGALSEVEAAYRPSERRLELTFPDSSVVSGEVQLEEAIVTRFFSRPARAHPVTGPWSAALSEHAGRPLRLVEGDGARPGVDRGRAGAVSLIGQASLEALAAVAQTSSIDGRRFRMLIEVAGSRPHEEDGWVRRRLRVGEALIGMHGHVGRCLVTSRHPDTGAVDLATLDLLRSYREDMATTEPLAFGIYGEVLEPGWVHIGDSLALC